LLGFDVVESDGGTGIPARIHGFFDSVLVWGLVWAFNPSGLKSHGLWHGRVQIWMSRQKFIGRYGERAMNSQIAIPARSGR
jgi:putative NADPH-quinone reductase